MVAAVLPALVPLGLLFVAITVLSNASALERVERPGPELIAVVAVMVVLGQALLGISWDRLLPAIDDRAALAWTYHGSQPAKYVPIGIAQPLGQIGLLRSLGPEAAVGAVVWASHVIVMASAGLFLGASLAVVDDIPPLLRLAGIGILAPLAIYRPVQRFLLLALRRVIRQVPAPQALPTQRALVESFACALIGLALHSLAFALLAEGSIARVAPAYALSFSLSLLTPLPAGLGVREALIVWTTGLDPPVALAAALLFRFVLIGSELALFTLSGILFRSTRRRQDSLGDTIG